MEILFIEPYLGGSHTQFLEAIIRHSGHNWHTATLPGRHWQARMATAAAFIANDGRFQETLSRKFDLVVCTSFLNWVEFAGFRPEFGQLPSVMYFHENQLAYMKDGVQSKLDWKFGFAQLVSALKANAVLFNSRHNMETFLTRARRFLRRFDDGANPDWAEMVRAKSKVVGYPVEFVDDDDYGQRSQSLDKGPVILWNHRWEADKNPAEFFDSLYALNSAGFAFRIIVCGGQTQSPEIKQVFTKAYSIFSQSPTVKILHWGFADSRVEYHQLIQTADIVVSTAWQEFFGVSVMEAVAAGATPLLPNRLAYPELFPNSFLYNHPVQLTERLKDLCSAFKAGRALPKVRSEVWEVHRAALWCRRFDKLLLDIYTGE